MFCDGHCLHFIDEEHSLKEVNLPVVTDLVNGEAEVQTQICLTPKPLPWKALNPFKIINPFKNLSDGLPLQKIAHMRVCMLFIR